MKPLLQIFLVGYLIGLAFANSIENPNLLKSSQSTEKSTSNIQDTHTNAASNQFLSIETQGPPKEKEKGSVSQTLNSIAAHSPTENTKGQTNSTESRPSKEYTKDQEQLIHSDSQESLLKGNQLFPSAAGTSLKRSYSPNNSTNPIESAGTGHYGKTLGVHGQEYGYTDADHNGEGQHGHENDHHHQSKPLKPSIVHRDPHDKYDHHDKIRTLDRDHIFYDKHKADYGYKQHEPYHYDGQKIPDCVQKNIYFYNLTFCLEDHHYPKDNILWAIKQAGEHAYQLLTDVTYQSADNLIDSLTRAEEEGHLHQQVHHPNQNKHFKRSGYSDKAHSHQKDGYICPSDIYYGRPRRAMNTYGKWKVIVNLDHVPHHHPYHHQTHLGDHSSDEHHRQYHHEILPAGSEHTGYGHAHSGEYFHNHNRNRVYTQTLRLEQCTNPNTPCSYIDSHYQSRCLQKHNFVRLVAWTYDMGLHVDTFKMPIACSCHVKQSNHYHDDHESEQGHHTLPHHEHEEAGGNEYGLASESAAVTVPTKTE